jgi:branched-chain amino acid aminotransferase
VFETVKYVSGRLYQLDPHLERMKRSAQGIHLEPPCSWEELRAIMLDVAAAGKEKDGQMRILIGRGPGGFGIDPYESPEPSLYIAAYRFAQKPEAWFAKGLTGFRTSIPAKQSYLAKIKNANYLPNALMIREARERGADVPFCFDEHSFLAESSVANICLVDKNGVLVAPELTNSLPGTTMLRGMELIKDEVAVAFRQIPEPEIFEAREAIMLGTGPDCVSIVSYEGKPLGNGKPGPVSELLRRRIMADILATGTPIRGLA